MKMSNLYHNRQVSSPENPPGVQSQGNYRLVLSFTGKSAGQETDKAGEQHHDRIKDYLMGQLIKYTELRSIMP